ncbi:hypothetical protein AYO44_15240 [Planctomycetaceae bacterium SCGC AG-212-F19]|nr:hypothetical protein AYO44_15240 [Planctomycetaceae bacterium SCGC AG-212-F19]
MKLDKESIVKHQFWIGFVLLILLIFGTLLWLQGVSAESNVIEGQKLKGHKDELDKLMTQPPRNKTDIRFLKDRVSALERRREEIWKRAWEMQEPLMTWPPKMQPELGKLAFGTEIKDDAVRGWYPLQEVYKAQVDQLSDTFRIKTTIDKEDKSFELVQFKEGPTTVLTLVKDWTKLGKAPTSEEVWLAQEDIWVQREILNAVREAVYTVAGFKKVKDAPAAGKGELFRETYANAEWQIELVLVQSKEKYVLKGRIKNVTDHPLPLGKIYFHVLLHQEGGKPVVLPVEGDTLPAGKDWPIADYALDLAARPDGILGVMELYESRTSPIRRIDEIVLGAMAHRTFLPMLQAAKFSQQAAIASTAAPRPEDAKTSTARGRDKSLPAADATPNGLVRDRYIDATEQVRRLPVGIVLLVDQGHIPEVLSALTNSKLRLQVTQVGWQHFRGTLTAPGAAPVGAANKPLRPGDPDSTQEQQSNLIELSIYCVASLYEQYRPSGRPVAAPAPAPPAPPAKTKE